MNDLDLIQRFRSDMESPPCDRIAAARVRLEREYEQARPPLHARRRRGRLLPAPAARVHPRGSLAAILTVPVVAAVALVLIVGTLGSHAPSAAEAAIIHHVDAALTPPPNEILHTEIEGPGFGSERWELTSAPYSFLAYKGPIGASVPEQAANGTTVSWYDPTTNTITESASTKLASQPSFEDPLAQIRQDVENGQARMVGTKQVDGVQTYEIEFADKGGAFGDGPIAYVDQNSYQPIQLELPQSGGQVAEVHVVAMQYLPATPANMQLLSLTARHPSATVVVDSSGVPSTPAK